MTQAFSKDLYTNKAIGEGHITILGQHYSGIIQGTWIAGVDASQFLYGYFYNNSNAQNDQIDFKVYLATGTYTFSLLLVKSATAAIATILLDGVSLGTIDMYAAVNTYNQIGSISNLTVTSAGLKTLSVKAATRNGSSAGWTLAISSMSLFRTA